MKTISNRDWESLLRDLPQVLERVPRTDLRKANAARRLRLLLFKLQRKQCDK